MPSPANVADVVARWRPLSDQETTNAETFLEDAWVMLKRRFPTIEADAAVDLDLQSAIVRVLCSAVIRVLKNPDGLRQESIDDYAWTRDGTVSAGALYFTADELGDLTPNANGGVFTGDLLANYADRWADA